MTVVTSNEAKRPYAVELGAHEVLIKSDKQAMKDHKLKDALIIGIGWPLVNTIEPAQKPA